MLNCPACKATDVRRSRRKGLLDEFRALFGGWPFRCSHCNKRFWANQRSSNNKSKVNPPKATPASTAGIAVRTHDQKPVAQVLIQADSHEQLDKILLSLNHAMTAHDRRRSDHNPKAANQHFASQ